MKKLSFLLVLSGLVWSSCNKDPQATIKIENVKNTIATLSADSMMGRKTFTIGAKKAAQYISNRFEEIGLEPLDNEDSYLQRFNVTFLQPTSSSLQLNGKSVESNSYFVRSNYHDINWPDLTKINSRRIDATENFGDAFSDAMQSEQPLIVLLDPAHQNDFNRYAQYFGNGTQTLNPEQGSSILFVLTSSKTISKGHFEYNAQANEKEAFNVAGKITGTGHPEEKVIFSGHYDHLGIIKPVKDDSVANGADDDASGTTSVITLANYFKDRGAQSRTLIFVAFTGEEIGGYGSQYFSKQLNPDQIIAMFNIEMVGKPSKFGPNTAYLTGFDKSSLGSILQENLKNSPYKIYPDPYPDQHLFYRSDNATLARLGVPAHTISSVQIDKDQYYHSVDDELSTLNIEHLTNMIQAIAISSRSVISGADTPSRVDAATLN